MIQWLREGDPNTQFFHKVAFGRRCHSFIMPAMLLLLDNISQDFLKVAVTNVFKCRFTREGTFHIHSWDI